MVATIEQPGAVVRYELTASAGTSVTLTATEATLPSECSPLKLLDGDGRTPSSGCIMSGRSRSETHVLPSTGRFSIVVDPRGPSTGSVTLSLSSAG